MQQWPSVSQSSVQLVSWPVKLGFRAQNLNENARPLARGTSDLPHRKDSKLSAAHQEMAQEFDIQRLLTAYDFSQVAPAGRTLNPKPTLPHDILESFECPGLRALSLVVQI